MTRRARATRAALSLALTGLLALQLWGAIKRSRREIEEWWW